ncbi:MAG: glycosyltransferase family 2 protein [Phycisphaerales bacterium]|nr:glycosyltransferase family 2 protein [Phycisphaerales bacterium]
MAADLHTFVVPAYGDSPYLEECLRSLQAQSMQSRIVLCTSTPSRIIDAAADRFGVPVLVNPHRQGMAEDWTFAYRAAETPYVTLAHQDDRYLPDYNATLVRTLERAGDSLLGFSDYAEIIGGEWRVHRVNLWIKRAMLRGTFLFSSVIRARFRKRLGLSLGCPICCPSVMFHKQRIGDIHFDSAYRFVVDWEAWLRLSEREGAFVYVPRRLLGHRLHHETETTRRTQGTERLREELEMLSKFWPASVAWMLLLGYRLGHRSNRAGNIS